MYFSDQIDRQGLNKDGKSGTHESLPDECQVALCKRPVCHVEATHTSNPTESGACCLEQKKGTGNGTGEGVDYPTTAVVNCV